MAVWRAFLPCYNRLFRINSVAVSQLLKINDSIATKEYRRSLHDFTNPFIENKLKRKDEIIGDYKIIYRAPYETYCKICYGVVLGSSTIFPALFSSLVFQQGIDNYPLQLWGKDLMSSNLELAVFTGGLLFALVSSCIVLFKYPYRIYYSQSEKKYIMVFQHFILWKRDKREFVPGEMKKSEQTLTIWKDSLFEIGNKKAIIFEDYFQRPSDFNNMLEDPDKKM